MAPVSSYEDCIISGLTHYNENSLKEGAYNKAES